MPSSHIRVSITLSDKLFPGYFQYLKDFREQKKQLHESSHNIGLVFWDVIDASVQNYPAVTYTKREKSNLTDSGQSGSFFRNGIRYFIIYSCDAPNDEHLDAIIERDLVVLENILNSIQFN